MQQQSSGRCCLTMTAFFLLHTACSTALYNSPFNSSAHRPPTAFISQQQLFLSGRKNQLGKKKTHYVSRLLQFPSLQVIHCLITQPPMNGETVVTVSREVSEEGHTNKLKQQNKGRYFSVRHQYLNILISKHTVSTLASLADDNNSGSDNASADCSSSI